MNKIIEFLVKIKNIKKYIINKIIYYEYNSLSKEEQRIIRLADYYDMGIDYDFLLQNKKEVDNYIDLCKRYSNRICKNKINYRILKGVVSEKNVELIDILVTLKSSYLIHSLGIKEDNISFVFDDINTSSIFSNASISDFAINVGSSSGLNNQKIHTYMGHELYIDGLVNNGNNIDITYKLNILFNKIEEYNIQKAIIRVYRNNIDIILFVHKYKFNNELDNNKYELLNDLYKNKKLKKYKFKGFNNF